MGMRGRVSVQAPECSKHASCDIATLCSHVGHHFQAGEATLFNRLTQSGGAGAEGLSAGGGCSSSAAVDMRPLADPSMRGAQVRHSQRGCPPQKGWGGQPHNSATGGVAQLVRYHGGQQADMAAGSQCPACPAQQRMTPGQPSSAHAPLAPRLSRSQACAPTTSPLRAWRGAWRQPSQVGGGAQPELPGRRSALPARARAAATSRRTQPMGWLPSWIAP